MTNPSINFKVGDDGVSSFMDRLKQKSDTITSQAIKDAQIQTTSAKEQLKLLEEKIKAAQRLSILQKQMAEASVKEGTQQRLGGIESRGHTIDYLYEKNKQDTKAVVERYKSGAISKEEYNVEIGGIHSRRKRIEALAAQNTEGTILAQGSKTLKETRENERTNQILAAYMRENINTIKQTSQQQVNAVKSGDEKLGDITEKAKTSQEKLTAQLTTQKVKEEGAAEDAKKPGFIKSILGSLAVERVGGMLAALPSTANEFEYIKPMMSMMGAAIGGGLGMISDAIWNTNAAGVGANVGSRLGEFGGEAVSRTYKSRDELQIANMKLKAMGFAAQIDQFGTSYSSNGENSSARLGGTGMFSNFNQDYSAYGLNMKQVSDLQSNIAMRAGRLSGLEGGTNAVLAAKGVGVGESTSMALMEMMRANKSGDRDVAVLISSILNKGIFKDGDRAYLNEFLTKNYMQLQKTLLQTQGVTSSGAAAEILGRFDKMGGQFAKEHPNSIGLISGIQSSLANPGSESMKALMFTLMRREHPEMELGDLQVEMQKGLNSPKQLQSLMKFVTSQGGSKSYQMQQVAGAFGLEGNLSAAKELLEGYGQFGESFDYRTIGGGYSKESMMGMSKGQTSPYTEASAAVQNEFIKSSVLGIELVGKRMTGLMGDMLDGLQLYLEKRIKEMVSGSKENEVVTPTGKRKKKYSASGQFLGYE